MGVMHRQQAIYASALEQLAIYRNAAHIRLTYFSGDQRSAARKVCRIEIMSCGDEGRLGSLRYGGRTGSAAICIILSVGDY